VDAGLSSSASSRALVAPNTPTSAFDGVTLRSTHNSPTPRGGYRIVGCHPGTVIVKTRGHANADGTSSSPLPRSPCRAETRGCSISSRSSRHRTVGLRSANNAAGPPVVNRCARYWTSASNRVWTRGQNGSIARSQYSRMTSASAPASGGDVVISGIASTSRAIWPAGVARSVASSASRSGRGEVGGGQTKPGITRLGTTSASSRQSKPRSRSVARAVHRAWMSWPSSPFSTSTEATTSHSGEKANRV
jgi:hypothetical protein